MRRPGGQEEFRRTEREVRAVRGITPKSTLQFAGAGHVGTASVRGMPVLQRLRDAGYHVWPFDPPRLPLVVEIYPRALTGSVVKSRSGDRGAFLSGAMPDSELRVRAASTEDAFDAAVSALAMSEALDEIALLDREPAYALEGKIWTPRAAPRLAPARALTIPRHAVEQTLDEEPLVAALEQIAGQLDRLLEAVAEISAKLDVANERLADLNRSQWS